jgi:hypothetical protein
LRVPRVVSPLSWSPSDHPSAGDPQGGTLVTSPCMEPQQPSKQPYALLHRQAPEAGALVTADGRPRTATAACRSTTRGTIRVRLLVEPHRAPREAAWTRGDHGATARPLKLQRSGGSRQSAAAVCYALVPELIQFGNLESSDVWWPEDLVHKIPVALLGKIVLNSDRIGIMVLTGVTPFPHHAASDLGLQILGLSRNSRENRTSFKGRPNISNGLARRGSDI